MKPTPGSGHLRDNFANQDWQRISVTVDGHAIGPFLKVSLVSARAATRTHE
jgi:hypothetical protein